MMKFLKGGMAGMTAERKPLDNFNKFGVNLYLAGACEALCQERNLDGRDRSRVLDESVQVMGFKKSHAQSFAEKYEEYLMADPRYMQMFQAGRNAMNTYLTDEDHAAKHICQWRSKKGPPRRCKKGPLGGCGLVPVVHGRAPRATRRALNRLTRRRAREGPVGPRGQAWAGWSVQLAVGV